MRIEKRDSSEPIIYKELVIDTGSFVTILRKDSQNWPRRLQNSKAKKPLSSYDRRSLVDLGKNLMFDKNNTNSRLLSENISNQNEQFELNFVSGTIKAQLGYKDMYFPTCEPKDLTLSPSIEPDSESVLVKVKNVKVALANSLFEDEKSSISGILGMSFGKGLNQLVNQMFLQRAISKRIFGINFVENSKINQMVSFGEINKSIEADDENVAWLSVKSDSTFWSMHTHKNYINLKTANTKRAVSVDETIEIILDTGSLYIAIHYDLFAKFINALESIGIFCFLEVQTRYIECEAKQPIQQTVSFEVILGKNKFEFAKNDLLEPLGRSRFKLNAIPIEEPLLILGIPFLKNYYSIFDFDNKRVGLYSLENVETPKIRESQSGVFGFTACFIFVIFGAFVFIKKYKNKNKMNPYHIFDKV